MSQGTLTLEGLARMMRELGGAPAPAYRAPFSFDGLEVRTSPYMNRFVMEPRKQFRFPRSKGRRIRKKWARRPENWRQRPAKSLQPLIYQTPFGLLMHPKNWDAMKRQLLAPPA